MITVDVDSDLQLEIDISKATPEERIGINELSVIYRRTKKPRVPLMHFREISRSIKKYAGQMETTDRCKAAYDAWVKDLEAINQIKSSVGKYKIPESFGKHIKKEPYDYQLADFLYFMKRKRGMLLYDPGVGKTNTSIMLATYLYRMRGAKNILYVCPAHLKYQTRDEFRNFSDLNPILLDANHKTYSCPLYSEHLYQDQDPKCLKCDQYMVCKKKSRRSFDVRRAEHLMEDKGVFIANYELMRTRPDLFALHKYWDLICFDEFSRVKAWKENSTVSAFKQLKTNYVILASATPIENRLEDLYNAVTFCNPDILGSKSNFTDKHCELDDYHSIIPNDYKEIDLFRKKIATISVRRTIESVYESLPPHPIYINSVAELKGSQKKLYKQLTGPVYANEARDNMVATRSTAMKLRRLCNWSGMIDPMTNDSGKLEVLSEIIQGISGQCIIYSEWSDMVVKISESIGKEATHIFGQQSSTGKSMNAEQKNEKVKQFINGDYKFLIATNCLKDGVNLQNAQYLINFELPWNPAILKQRVGRLRWQRQDKHQCVIYNIFTEGTFEDRVRELIFSKGDLFEKVIDRLGDYSANLNDVKQLHKLIFEKTK